MKTSMVGRARRLLATSAVFALALALILTTIAMAWSPAIVGTYVPAEIYGDMWDIAVSGNETQFCQAASMGSRWP